MEEQIKTTKEKQPSLEYFFNGYVDYSRTDAARMKITTVYLLLEAMTIAWVLLFFLLDMKILLGYTS